MQKMNKSAHQYSFVINSPLGRLGVQTVNNKVHRLDYLAGSARLRAASGDFDRKVETELENYFDNPAVNFSLPVELAGTPCLGSGARAVGNACRHNPVSIIVPCHRVVAAHGIGGYSGSTSGPLLDRKCWLLQHEGLLSALKKPA